MEPQNTGEKSAQIVKGEHSIPEDKLRCSSASLASVASAVSEFSFDDPYQINRSKHGSFAIDHEHSEHQPILPEKQVSDSCNATGANPSSTLSLESPPVQVMERPPEASSGYRIPSHVFARNKSNAPNAEWSTASNESLFSIHTGNMSFTRDQFSWLLKSGELGMYGPGDILKSGELGKLSDLRKSGELPPPSPKNLYKSGEQKIGDIRKSGEQMPPMPPQDIPKSGEQIIAAHFKATSTTPPEVNSEVDVGLTSPPPVNEAPSRGSSAGPKKDDPKPEMNAKKGWKLSISDEIPLSASVSHHSDASNQSFAFPVLAEIEREKSVNSGKKEVDRQKNSSLPEEEQPPNTTNATPEPAAAPASSWFSCFSCCSCR